MKLHTQVLIRHDPLRKKCTLRSGRFSKHGFGEMVRHRTYLSEGRAFQPAESAAHPKLLSLLVYGWHLSEGAVLSEAAHSSSNMTRSSEEVMHPSWWALFPTSTQPPIPCSLFPYPLSHAPVAILLHICRRSQPPPSPRISTTFCKTSVATHTLLQREDHPTSTVFVRIPDLYQNQQQLWPLTAAVATDGSCISHRYRTIARSDIRPLSAAMSRGGSPARPLCPCTCMSALQTGHTGTQQDRCAGNVNHSLAYSSRTLATPESWGHTPSTSSCVVPMSKADSKAAWDKLTGTPLRYELLHPSSPVLLPSGSAGTSLAAAFQPHCPACLTWSLLVVRRVCFMHVA